jgi:hypothetical protein
MRQLWIVLGPIFAALIIVGCALVTGSTDGYSLDAGARPACTSANDCDGGVCCLTITASPMPTAAFICQPSCPDSISVQLCKASGECLTPAEASSPIPPVGDGGDAGVDSGAVDAGDAAVDAEDAGVEDAASPPVDAGLVTGHGICLPQTCTLNGTSVTLMTCRAIECR